MSAMLFSLGGFSFAFADSIATLNSQSYIDKWIYTPGGNPDSFGQSGISVDLPSWLYQPGASHSICNVAVSLAASGSPTDSVQMKVFYEQNATLGVAINSQSGLTPDNSTYMQTSAASWQVRGSTPTVYTFSFAPCIPTAGGYFYFFEVSRTGSSDSSNYYFISGDNSAGLQRGTQSGTGHLRYYHKIQPSTWVAYDSTAGSGDRAFSDIVINGTENFGLLAPTSSPSFAQSVINETLGINDATASSTASNKFAAFTNFPAYLANRVPFGYLWSIRDIYNNAATTTSAYGGISLDLSNLAVSSSTAVWLAGARISFSTTTVAYYFGASNLDTFNALASAGIIMGLMYNMYKRILRVGFTV